MKITFKNTASLFVWLSILAFTPAETQAQKNTWGLGVRLGDPTGITAKKYFRKNALEISLGRTHNFYGKGWYNRRFDRWYDGKSYPYRDVQYLGYGPAHPLTLQVNYLFHRSLGKAVDADLNGLDWYFGFGGQFAYQRYAWDYRYKLEGDPNWYYVRNESISEFDLGVNGVIGLEYTFKEYPLSVFLDATLFLEVIDDPFVPWTQGGTGVRYNF